MAAAEIFHTPLEPVTVGVRMLNQQTRQVLDLVREGHPVIVTDDGTPIARIIPEGLSPLERLIAEGEYVGDINAPLGDVPAVSLPGGRTTAEALDEVRADRV